MLKQRIITAILIVAVLFVALALLPPIWLSAVFAVVILLAAWEWSDLSGLQSPAGRGFFVLACLVAMALLAWNVTLYQEIDALQLREVLAAVAVWWAISLLWVKGYPQSAGIWGSRFLRVAMGLLVLAPAWLAISYLGFLRNGPLWILLVVALVAAADIGAYFSGRRWGKRKLAPSVSPGKSWEGFWGGLVSAMLLMALIHGLFTAKMPGNLPAMMALAAFTVLASVLGDLLESMVKRHRGIKDSGQLLPGHGGLLDRIDSLTAAVPVFTLGLLSVGWG